jgi:4-amino-4-deoxy-L-arabinose transferase-like glycosyltransferase
MKKQLIQSNVSFDSIAIVLTVIFVIFLLIFGWKVYPEHMSGGNDPVDKADLIRHGILPRDVFRPLFYPLLAAGLGSLLDNTFVGAKCITTIMAGVYVFSTYLLTKVVVDQKAALMCLFFMMTNLHIIVFGILPSTDMLCAALGTLALLFSVHILLQPGYTLVFLSGMMFALAYFTRYQAMLLLPTLLLVLFLSSKQSISTFLRYLFVFLVAILIFLTPHVLLTMRIFDKPLYDENWKNVAAKLYYDKSQKHHEPYLANVPFHSLSEVILHSPRTFFASSLQELQLFLRFGVSNIVGLPPFLAGLFFIGGYLMLFSSSKAKLILLSFVGIYVISLSLAFFASHARLLLPILPVCYLIIADFLVMLHTKVSKKIYNVSPIMLLAMLIVVAKILTILPDLRNFAISIQQQP